MYTSNPSRPGRQTMQNIKPTDYVPFEHAVRMAFHTKEAAASQSPVAQPKNIMV